MSYGNFFYIVSDHNGMVLDIEHGSKDQGAKLILWPFNGGENQKWRFNEYGFITSVNSGHVLDVEGGAIQGRHLIQWPGT